MRGVALLVCAACATPAARSEQAVTNGGADAGHPAVIALVDNSGEVQCTASLITPRTGVTAAHCFGAGAVWSLRAFAGSDLDGAGTYSLLSDVRRHPRFDPSTLANDVAVFTLRDELTIAPLALDARAIDASLVATKFEVVGFGTTGTGADAGIKRTGTARIAEVRAEELRADPDPAQPCRGDSGGPMLITPDAVTAVVSRGDSACSDHAIYIRLDIARASLIDPYVAATAPGTARTGDACFYAGHCDGGPCLQTRDDPVLYFCSRACSRDRDCPDAMTCTVDGCRYPEPSPGALGSPCMADSQCTSGTCREQACTVSCLGSPDACPADYECRGEGLSRYCFAAPGGCDGCSGGRGTSGWLILLWLARCGRKRK
jgi:hypothetical protein